TLGGNDVCAVHHWIVRPRSARVCCHGPRVRAVGGNGSGLPGAELRIAQRHFGIGPWPADRAGGGFLQHCLRADLLPGRDRRRSDDLRAPEPEMKSPHARKLVTLATAAVLALSLSAAMLLLHILQRQTESTKDDDVLYIASGKTLKRMSLGYDGLLADLYWTRAVQYFGRRHHADETGYRLLGPLLRITSDLDPHLLPTYEYGSVFLAQRPPEGAGDPHAAVELVRTGITEYPDQWRLYSTLGFIYSSELKDYRSAAEAFRQGSQAPGAHPWLA